MNKTLLISSFASIFALFIMFLGACSINGDCGEYNPDTGCSPENGCYKHSVTVGGTTTTSCVASCSDLDVNTECARKQNLGDCMKYTRPGETTEICTVTMPCNDILNTKYCNVNYADCVIKNSVCTQPGCVGSGSYTAPNDLMAKESAKTLAYQTCLDSKGWSSASPCSYYTYYESGTGYSKCVCTNGS